MINAHAPILNVAVVGAGRVGSALAAALYKCGYRISGVASRSAASALRLATRVQAPASADPPEVTLAADVVLITVPDRKIRAVTENIARRGGFVPGQVVAHTSGALGSGELSAARECGAAVISIHPLQSFADTESGAARLAGVYFAVEGDAAARPAAERIVRDLGGVLLHLKSEDKALYHAAACVASNYLVALIHMATDLLRRCGLDREHALKALVPLLDGTLRNIKEMGAVGALTGPVARGDIPTLEWHLDAFARRDAGAGELYRRLGLYALRVAREKGSVESGRAAAIAELLEGGRHN